MKVNQISLFLENEPGHLSGICKVLSDSGINIVTLSLADTAQFGILRLVVDDWQRAKACLEAAGRVVRVTEVVAAEVDDAPGGLTNVLTILQQDSINIEYMYAFAFCKEGKAALVFRFDRPDAAISLLKNNNVTILSESELIVCSRKE